MQNMDFTSMNHLFNGISACAIIAFIAIVTPWIQLTAADDSYNLICNTLSKIYLEKYESQL
jgi:hypothetical protein